MKMDNNNLYSTLESSEWVHIPDSTFIIKYKFEEEGYSIIVSDLKQIFGESLKEAAVQQKFSDSNPHAEMKTKIIIKNIKHSLDEGLRNNASICEVSYNEKYVRIQLQFCVNQVSFIFNLEPVLLLSQELRNHIIVPTLSHTLFTQLENSALKKRINDLENKLNSSISPQKPLLDHRINSNIFSLYNNNVSDAVIINAFLEVQNAMKNSSRDREKFFELHKKHTSETLSQQQTKSSKASIKREIADVSESKFEIKYDDEEGQTSQRPISEIPALPKVKKKRNLKF